MLSGVKSVQPQGKKQQAESSEWQGVNIDVDESVPKGWWELHGGEAKELQAIARALSKVPSPCNLIIRSGTADVNRKVLGVGAVGPQGCP